MECYGAFLMRLSFQAQMTSKFNKTNHFVEIQFAGVSLFRHPLMSDE